MTDQRHESPADEPAVEFGDYLIQELIGTGGMAEVYRARRRDASADVGAVVIKRVKPLHAGDPAFVRMFVDEAKLSAQLQHPNIVSVLEYGEQAGHHFIAMEYIDGLHLQGLHVRYAQRHQRSLPWPVGLHIARDVLRALEYAHSKQDDQGRPMGLIHRDINLVNVMVSRRGEVKLLDFGIVKAADGIRSAETVSGVLKGKFGYMSPEQAEGKPLDRRSDVFSASIVLHELLTGRRLFWGKDDLEILRRVRSGDVPDPRQFAPEVPEELVAAVTQGLERDLAGRYQTAGAMAEALDGVIERQQVPASVLRDLLLDLLGEERTEASDRMAARRRKMTLLAWKQGVREQEAPRRRRFVAGTLGGEDTKGTAPGRKAAGMESLRVEHDTVIATDIKWMSVQGADALEPVVSEQAQAALEAAGEAEPAAELDEPESEPGEHASPAVSAVPSLGQLAQETQILDDESDLAGAELETRILDDETDLAGAAVETRILDDEADLAGAEAETRILDDESDLPGAAPADAPAPAPAPPGLDHTADETGITAPPGRALRLRIRILLAITAASVVAAVLLLLFKSC